MLSRRYATKPVGDRLYVREHWKTSIVNDGVAPRDLTLRVVRANIDRPPP
ncbi:hypothetical protein [Sphingomonas sp. 10B4]|nr:hypothetical protein [Sphingomonas sp. 10B4]MDY7525375.1 hypothetical protein [Sphingomonas sp. 10B4]MEB0282894.1 hypothetical protein [Sphingomonas sp. 10B4]